SARNWNFEFPRLGKTEMTRIVLQVFAVVAFFLIWKGYVHFFDVSPLVLPAPELVVVALFRLLGQPDTYYHLGVTLAECLGGFLFAVVFGTVIGQLLGRVALLDTIFKPFVIALQVTPKVALIPLFILWFGFGLESKIIVSAVLAFFPVFANSYLGAKSVDRGLSEVFTVGQAKQSPRTAGSWFPGSHAGGWPRSEGGPPGGRGGRSFGAPCAPGRYSRSGIARPPKRCRRNISPRSST